jgi:hypothetical protein
MEGKWDGLVREENKREIDEGREEMGAEEGGVEGREVCLFVCLFERRRDTYRHRVTGADSLRQACHNLIVRVRSAKVVKKRKNKKTVETEGIASLKTE